MQTILSIHLTVVILETLEAMAFSIYLTVFRIANSLDSLGNSAGKSSLSLSVFSPAMSQSARSAISIFILR